LAETPALALRAVTLELCRCAALARAAAGHALNVSGRSPGQLHSERDAAEQLSVAIGEFVARMQRSRLTPDVADRLAQVLRTGNHFHAVADGAKEVAGYSALAAQVEDSELLQLLNEYRSMITGVLERADPQAAAFRPDALRQSIETVELSYPPLKRALLIAGTKARLRISELAMLLEYVHGLRNIVELTGNGMRDLVELLEATGARAEAATPAAASGGHEALSSDKRVPG
jgi:hypothetical protein